MKTKLYKITDKVSFVILKKSTIYWTHYNVHSMHLVVNIYISHMSPRKECLVFPFNTFIRSEFIKLQDGKLLSKGFIIMVINAIKLTINLK